MASKSTELNGVQKGLKDPESAKKLKKRKKIMKGPVAKKRNEDVPVQLIPAVEDDSDCDEVEEPGSLEIGDEAFTWMVGPVDPKEFYNTYWEKRPLHIKRGDPAYYKDLFSTKALEKIVREQRVLYGKHMDITSYDGKRETHNPTGRVYPAVMWDYFNNGASIRMINPQYFHNRVWRLCATLQDHFQNMVGANVYLTPPGTQGFAPHWDDVEVFMLQLEGKKHWKLYEPDDKLPRFSSDNLDESALNTPILEVDLEPGDMIYMPRGTIHQGKCLAEHHSLHVTISSYQLNTWTDLLEKLLPAALSVAAQEDIEFRQGLPRNYLQHLGLVHSEQEEESPERASFLNKVKSLMGKLLIHAPVDAAVDQLGKKLMLDALPPALEESEKCRTVHNDGERWNTKKNCVVNRVEIDPNTRVRLVRSTAVRLVQEGEGEETVLRIYYSTENTREYHEAGEQFLEVDADIAPAIEELITTYPAYSSVEDLPGDELEAKMRLVGDLWEKGILITSQPLDPHYDDP